MVSTVIRRSWDVRIHNAGTMVPGDGTVDFVIPLGRLIAPPPFGSSTSQPLAGTAQQLPYVLEVLDVEGELTASAFDGGRFVLLGRLAEVRVSTDGSLFETVDIRRISDYRASSEPRLEIELSDERWLLKHGRIFERNTSSQLFPITGVPTAWFTFPTSSPGQLRVNTIWIGDNNFIRLAPDDEVTTYVRERVPFVVAGDLVDNIQSPNVNGNFKNLRLITDGDVEHVVHGFHVNNPDITPPTPEAILGTLLENLETGTHPPNMRFVWVYWNGTPPALNTLLNARLVWVDPGLPTTPDSPALVGGFINVGLGVDDVVRNVLDGTYGGAPTRFDPDAVDDLEDLGLAQRWYKVDQPVLPDQFLSREIFIPHLIIPFMDGQGRIRPKPLVPTAPPDPGTLFRFDVSTTVGAPTMDIVGREARNRINFTWERAIFLSSFEEDFDPPQGVNPAVTITRVEDPVDGDTIPAIGAREHNIPTGTTFNAFQLGDTPILDEITGPILATFQDGMTEWRWSGHAQDDAPEAGDFVVLDCEDLHLPNPATAARSGDRVAVILERRRVYGPTTVHYEYRGLDLPPDLQP